MKRIGTFPKLELIKEDVETIVRNLPQVNIFEGKNILITGAAGMISSYFVYVFSYLNEYVFKRPAQLYLIVRSKKNRRIDTFKSKPYIHFLDHDITKPVRLRVPMNYIVHAASFAAPQVYLQNPLYTLNTNILGLYNLLALDQSKLKCFLYFSSAELYGTPADKDIPIKESYLGVTDFHDPRSCYVEAKRFGEVLCMNYFREKKLPVKIIRPFHIYSPEVDPKDTRVFGSFVRSAVAGKEIDIVGDGKTRRSFCYITDAITLILRLINSPNIGEVYNIGNQKTEVSMYELANKIVRLSKSSSDVVIHNKKNVLFTRSAPLRLCPDMTKTIHETHYTPFVSLTEGFSRLIQSA